MAAPFTCKWGILATGYIAETFVKDLLCNPAAREVHDVAHEVVAVASSSSASRARDFLVKVGGPVETAKTYGSYAELVADPNVDVIYVATPHSHHFQNAMLALQAGKNVLCEKALTVNAEQTKELLRVAKEKNLFFMEAVWTRFFPMCIKIREMIEDGEIGQVIRVIADFSFASSAPEGKLDFPNDNRMVNLELAGGALLDLGIYSITWVFQALYTTQKGEKEKPIVHAAVNKYAETGADEMTSVILQFPKHQAMGIAMTGLRAGYDNGEGWAPVITITGTKGEIHVEGNAAHPKGYRVMKNAEPTMVEKVDCPVPSDNDRDGCGHGMFWEADEVARCLRDGKKQSGGMSWEESIVIMETMDEVRRQGGLKYPDLIESSVFDPQSPLNLGRS